MTYFLSIATCVIFAGVSVPAIASIDADVGTFATIAAPSGVSVGAFQVARRGAGDPAGDDRGGANRRGRGGSGRGGHDDGPNHA